MEGTHVRTYAHTHIRSVAYVNVREREKKSDPHHIAYVPLSAQQGTTTTGKTRRRSNMQTTMTL